MKVVERRRMFCKNKSLVHFHVQFLHRHVEGRRKARQPANLAGRRCGRPTRHASIGRSVSHTADGWPETK